MDNTGKFYFCIIQIRNRKQKFKGCEGYVVVGS